MDPQDFIDFLGTLEKLKCNTRHGWTSTGRQESVAEHSWRLAVMALLLRDEFPALDMQRVITMCLVHDWGEAITGDVPAFEKTAADERSEDAAIHSLLGRLPPGPGAAFEGLFAEMAAQQSPEARLWRALDKLEALIQHNEADTATWLPSEHDFQQSYGNAECETFEYTRALRALAARRSAEKTAEYRAGDTAGCAT